MKKKHFNFKITILQDFFRMGGTEQQTLKFYKTLDGFNKSVCLGLFFKGGFLEVKLKSFDVVTNLISTEFLKSKYISNTILKTKSDLIICMGKLANIYSNFLARVFKKIKIIQTLRTGKNLSFLKKTNYPGKCVLANSLNSKTKYLFFIKKQVRGGSTLSNLPAYLIKKVHFFFNLKFRRKFRIKKNTNSFLCIATFRYKKGHLCILNTIKKLIFRRSSTNTRVHVLLVGGGPLFNKCLSYVKRYSLEGSVFFIKSSQNTSVFYHITNYSILTSIQESLPNFLMESVRAQNPVICYNTAGSGECFFDNKTGLIAEFKNKKMLFNYLAINLLYKNITCLLRKNIRKLIFSKQTGLLFNKLRLLI